MPSFDFAKLLQDAKSGNAWPDDTYDFEVAQAAYITAGTGTPGVEVKLRCLLGTYANKTVKNTFYMSVDNPAALNIFFRHMRGFGLDDGFFNSLGDTDLSPVAQALMGKRARVKLGHRDSPQYGTQNTIVSVDPMVGGSTPSNIAPPPQIAPPPVAPTNGVPTNVVPITPAPQAQPVPTNVMPQTLSQNADMPAPAAVPPPPVAPYAEAPAPVAAPAAPAAVAIPPGFTPELWNTMPQSAKDAILAQQANLPV
jgi:hypothetical protein